MANRAYLLAVDDRAATWTDDPERTVLAEGIEEVPVFWASLFTPQDRQIDAIEGGDETLEVANWCVDSGTARQRLEELREPIARLLDDRSRQLWEQWVAFLVGQSPRYFKTNADEVWGLDPDGYEDYCATLLTAFSNPSAESLKAANPVSGVNSPISVGSKPAHWADSTDPI